MRARRRLRRRRLARARRQRRRLCVFEVTARRAVARELGSRRQLLGVGWLEAGRRRTRARDAIISRSARFSTRLLRALGGGYGGDESLALGVSAVASTCLRRRPGARWRGGSGRGGGCLASAGLRPADAARELEARSSCTRLASQRRAASYRALVCVRGENSATKREPRAHSRRKARGARRGARDERARTPSREDSG